MAFFHRSFFINIIIVVSGICTLVDSNSMTCGTGMSSPGYTYPVGDITLEYGDDLNVLCILRDDALDTYGENASYRMSFRHANVKMPSDIFNSTAIKLHIARHALTSSADYSCFIDEQLVCHNIVTVGTKPKPVQDFDCIGRNYENFTCTWTMPQNYVKTNYTLTYKPVLRPQRYSNSSKKKDPISTLNCPQMICKEDSKCSCTWSLSTDPQYRHAYEKFEFNLTANNTFGTRSMETTLNHFSRVIPNPPENLTAVALDPHSISLSWVIPVHVRDFAGGLNHKISYWINGKNYWTTLPSMYSNGKISKATMEKVLDNLPYAHWLYDIRVSMRSGNATEDRFWSANSSVHILTASKLPDRPPRTEIGCFEWLEGHIMIYWEKIEDYEENGQNFSYHIEVDVKGPKLKKLSSSYARFENVSEGMNYTFKIWSKNIKGMSKNYSLIFVPAKTYRPKPPQNLVKVDKGSGQYELEWSNTNSEATSFTLFWCNDLRDRPYQCDGKLHWEVVDRNVSNKSLILNENNHDPHQKNIFQLAISANRYQRSSGMIWAECTVIPGRGVKLRQTYVKDVGSTTMVVVWKLDCFKKGDLIGFNITYCPTMPLPQSSECISNTTKYTSVNDPRAETGIIRDLKPYTRYKLQVKPILNGSESQFSESMFNSTFEGEPTVPKNLRVVNVTNSSIFIEWEKPEQENGFIRYYNITIDNRIIDTKPHNKTQLTPYSHNITNLIPSINYTIKVEACTVNCSEATLVAATEVGQPSIIPKPSANWENSFVILKWAKPHPIEAKIEYYQVWISTNNKEQQYIHGNDIVQNVTSPMYNISICNEKIKNLYVRIRGVNILADKPLYGPWSDRADFPCIGDTSSETWTVIVIIIAVTVFIALMVYLGKKLRALIIRMSNVPVKLPDGLAAVVENCQEKEKHSDVPLLSSQSRNLSGGSSGCSSGHESVASSIESSSHLSASDSGTEQPRSPSLGEADTRDVSLRQRVTKPIGKKSEYVTMPEIQTPWASKQTPGYSVIGLMPTAKKPEPNSDYMVLSDLTSKSSYVPFTSPVDTESNSEPIMRPPTGYVPYMAQDSVAKNTDYVMAGTPSKNPIIPTVPFPRKEDNLGYVKAPPMDTAKPILTRFPWQQQQSVEPPSSGYVVVGDPKPQNIDLDLQQSSKGYVPHNIKFQATKSLKED